MGYWQYPPIVERFHVPIVITGFEPLDVLEGIRQTVAQLEAGQASVENAYERVCNFEGNKTAQKMLEEVFEVTDRAWRGIGTIPAERLAIEPRLSRLRRGVPVRSSRHRDRGIAVMPRRRSAARRLKPNQCEAFGKQCTPRNPLGATMVSAEGACAAYYNYGRFVTLEKAAQPVHA